ncbi:MAG: hypothetical protein AB1765_02080 [Candidatus Hydrogenedentota bacterium]
MLLLDIIKLQCFSEEVSFFMKRTLCIIFIFYLVSPLMGWNTKVKDSIIEDAIKSISPSRIEVLESKKDALFTEQARKADIVFSSYSQAAYKLNIEVVELFRNVTDEDAYLEQLAVIVNQVTELFDPFIISRERGIYETRDREFHNEVQEVLTDLRTHHIAPSYYPYSTPWMTPSYGNQMMTHPYAVQSIVPEAIRVAELRGKRVLALYLRGYNIYDLKGEIIALYAETVRTVARVIDGFLYYYQIRNRMMPAMYGSGMYGHNIVEVKIGDWYKEIGTFYGKKVSGLKGFGSIEVETEKGQKQEQAIENALRIALESEAVRKNIKSLYKVSDKDINTSGIEVKIRAGGYSPFGQYQMMPNLHLLPYQEQYSYPYGYESMYPYPGYYGMPEPYYDYTYGMPYYYGYQPYYPLYPEWGMYNYPYYYPYWY